MQVLQDIFGWIFVSIPFVLSVLILSEDGNKSILRSLAMFIVSGVVAYATYLIWGPILSCFLNSLLALLWGFLWFALSLEAD